VLAGQERVSCPADRKGSFFMQQQGPPIEVVFSSHALFELSRRNIDQEIIRQVALNPQQVLPSKLGRKIHQSNIQLPAACILPYYE
jgi:hypothetical protein